MFEIIYESSNRANNYSVGLYENYEIAALALEYNYKDHLDDLSDRDKYSISYESGKFYTFTNRSMESYETMHIISRDVITSEDQIERLTKTVYIGR
jgi:hypothetical protein